MTRKRFRTKGIRNPVRNAILFGLLTVGAITLVALGAMDMRASGRTGSALLMLGLFPALLCPIAFVHYLRSIAVVRGLRSGRDAVARWTVPADDFRRFCEGEARIPERSVMVNYYKPPHSISDEGIEVVFSEIGVLIGDGYFPLPTKGTRRLEGVRHVDSDPACIEFSLATTARVRTSSASLETVRTTHALRVPVAINAIGLANQVVRRYQSILHGRKA